MSPRLRLVPLFVAACALHAKPLELDVGPDRALTTLEAARDRLQELRAAGQLKHGAIVRVAPGGYARAHTFTLGANDSGQADAPIIWQAMYPGTRDQGKRRNAAMAMVMAGL